MLHNLLSHFFHCHATQEDEFTPGETYPESQVIKMGKKAKSANKSAMMAAAAMKRARRK